MVYTMVCTDNLGGGTKYRKRSPMVYTTVYHTIQMDISKNGYLKNVDFRENIVFLECDRANM